MAQRIKKAKGRALAEAALRLSQRVHDRYPHASITALDVPYTDEDLTLEVFVPEGCVLREVSDELIRLCLEIEDELGVSILTQVSRVAPKEAGAAT